MEKRKTSFLKEQVENTDLYKSLLNKIMTTHEECIRYNFLAPFEIPCCFSKMLFCRETANPVSCDF